LKARAEADGGTAESALSDPATPKRPNFRRHAEESTAKVAASLTPKIDDESDAPNANPFDSD
jgi:hypothetical protein